MYVIIAPIQIKEGCKEEFVKALLPNAQAAANTEPGCLRFDVIQDAGDTNRLWVYEIYVDEARLPRPPGGGALPEGHRDHGAHAGRPCPAGCRPRQHQRLAARF